MGHIVITVSRDAAKSVDSRGVSGLKNPTMNSIENQFTIQKYATVRQKARG
jgi:hypothetical protein